MTSRPLSSTGKWNVRAVPKAIQQLLNATTMNVVRVIAWLWGEPLGERRRKPGHFAQLAPHPLSRQTVLC